MNGQAWVGCVRGRIGDRVDYTDRAGISDETFDEFLAGQGLLAVCAEHSDKEIIAEPIAEALRRWT